MAAAVASPAPPAPSSARTEARAAAQSYLNTRLSPSASSASTAPSFRHIPQIDLAPSYDGGSLSARQAVAAQIRAACVESGFFYVTNHGIPLATCERMLALTQRFFTQLPREAKARIHVQRSSIFRGWEPPEWSRVNPEDWGTAKEGAEREAVVETKEAFNFGYEAGLDPTGGDGKYTELDGSSEVGNQWPAEADLPGFYEGVKEYYGGCLQLSRHLFRLFALSLSLPETHFDALVTHPGGISRLLYYPPSTSSTSASASTSSELGLGAHTDYECFTLLLQSLSPGLEILSPDGVWVSAPPIRGALVVNVADFLMRWTNGLYRSTVHRVVNRTPAERYSVPFFFSVNYDAVVETLPGCLKEGEKPWPKVRAGEYVLERLRATVKDA